jgi:hypothetical protein
LLSVRQDQPPQSTQGLHITVIRNAGINLPLYVGIVLAWHAATYYRELRDRQLISSPAISATAAVLAKLGLKGRPAA